MFEVLGVGAVAGGVGLIVVGLIMNREQLEQVIFTPARRAMRMLFREEVDEYIDALHPERNIDRK